MSKIGILRDRFVHHLDLERWRVGKTRAKLAKVDVSLVEDSVRFDRVQLMVKKEVTASPFDAPCPITKARGIQFTVNEASAYVAAPEYFAFSAALVDVSLIEEIIGGVRFLVVYSSKMSHEDIGEFATESEALRQDYAQVLIDERDGKNWDANVQKVHREALVAVYERLDKRLAIHARTGIDVVGKFQPVAGGRILYTVKGTVKSGHPDTSSGNGALNREVTMQSILNLPSRLRPARVRALIMGDDYLGWLYFRAAVNVDELTAALNDAEKDLGINPVRGIFEDIGAASFISLGLYRTIRGSVVALPKLGRLLSRLFWTVTPLQGRDPRRLASGIAASFYPLYVGCPFMRQFLKHHMQVPPLDVSDCNHYYFWNEVGLRKLTDPVDWNNDMIQRYGAAACLLDFSELMNGEQGAGLIYHPVVSHMLAVDGSDPCDRMSVIRAGI